MTKAQLFKALKDVASNKNINVTTTREIRLVKGEVRSTSAVRIENNIVMIVLD